MNLWIMAAIMIGLIAVVGFVVTAFDTNKSQEENLECSTCRNTCNEESNCGLSTCGAMQGRTCGCKG